MMKGWLDFSRTRLSVNRSITSYDKVRKLISRVLRNSRLNFMGSRWRQIKCRQYLDVGCGANVHGHCINLDYDWQPGVDVCWDVTRGIPIGSGTMRGVFSEHCIEHLPFERMDFVLSEFRRVLVQCFIEF